MGKNWEKKFYMWYFNMYFVVVVVTSSKVNMKKKLNAGEFLVRRDN